MKRILPFLVCIAALTLNASVFIDCPVPIEHNVPDELILIPEPQNFLARNGFYTYPDNVVIEADGNGAMEIAEILAEELRDYCGLETSVGTDGTIRLSINPAVNDGKAESYVFSSASDGVSIVGRDKRGLFYGAMTLLQMSRKSEKDGRINVQFADISDWPDIPNRGYFFELNANASWGGKSSFEWLKRCIRRFSAYYKCNMVGLGEAGAGCFPLKKYPFIEWERGLTADQIRELVELARKYQMEPYPVVEILGHAEGLFLKHEPGDTGDLNVIEVRRHGYTVQAFDFVEVDENGDANNAICLSHPDTRKVVEDVLDSVVELFGTPKFVHIGMDEMVPVGTCPRCREHETAQLFADYLNWIYDTLKAKGVENVLMWHDMLLDSKQWEGQEVVANSNKHETIKFFDAEATLNAVTHPALDRITKDLQLIYWHYGLPNAAPIDFLKEKGFTVWAATWKGIDLPYRVARVAKEKELPGIIGTSWTFSYWRGSVAPASADAMWAPSKNIRSFDRMERLYLDMLPPRPSEFQGTTSEPIALSGNARRDDVFARANVDQREDRTGGFVKGPLKIGKVNYDINDMVIGVAAPEAAKTLGLPAEATLPVNAKAVGLAFLQSGFGYSILRTDVIGTMTVLYEDGLAETAPIQNSRNIDVIQFHDAIDPESKVGGRRATDARLFELRSPWNWNLKFYSWEWVNPHPDKTIVSVTWNINDACSQEAFAIFGASRIFK